MVDNGGEKEETKVLRPQHCYRRRGEKEQGGMEDGRIMVGEGVAMLHLLPFVGKSPILVASSASSQYRVMKPGEVDCINPSRLSTRFPIIVPCSLPNIL